MNEEPREEGEERRGDGETRGRLAKVQADYAKWARRTTRILAGLCITQFVIGVLAIYLLNDSASQGDEIQEQRREAVRSACQEQNARHDNTIAKLKVLAARPRPGDERTPAQREAALTATIGLIEALAPKRNCEQRVRELVGDVK